ncbi:hypothetical protein [Amycolatopsis sp. BJA-103]|nr:hypothetical protein [Amycolatopsis sp. BJA-103]AUI57312.1 hypothetical protein BKN51_03180 [Amycolatopsis sp. BJA-103]PNE13259.1 hypothetical protein B1H26_41450 [Amycolatopsis sp. BJA-103]
MLDTTKGKTFENLRDRALLYFFIDTPSRLDEVATLTVDNPDIGHEGALNFDLDVAHVIGKG